MSFGRTEGRWKYLGIEIGWMLRLGEGFSAEE